jgi:hypothetical protein
MSENSRSPIVIDVQPTRRKTSCCLQLYFILMVLGLCGGAVYYSYIKLEEQFFNVMFWSCLAGSSMVVLELISTLIEHCSPKYKYRLSLIPASSGILVCVLTYFYFPNYYAVACGMGVLFHLVLLFCESQFSIRASLLREHNE